MKTAIKIISFFTLGINTICNGQTSNLSVEIDGLRNDTIFVQYAPISSMHAIDEPFLDTIYAANSQFQYNLPVEEPIIAYFFPKNAAFKRSNGSNYHPLQKHLFVIIKPNDRISVKGSLNPFYIDYLVSGSLINENLSELRKNFISKTAEAVKIELDIDSLFAINADREVINLLFNRRKEITNIGKERQLKYIKENPNSDLSVYLLSRQPLDTLGKYHNLLSQDVINGIFKKILETQFIQYQKLVKVRKAEKQIIEGNIAPDFILQSPLGTDLALKSLNKKYIILDFWGSWCGPCIVGFPKMKEYYNKYDDQIEILGIACNDREENWKKAIDKYELNWRHVINEEDINKDISVLYGIKSYPTKIILDNEKRIVGKFIGEGDDFYLKLDELLKEN